MITKEQAIDILEKFDFFQGQRAGRELWNDKPFDVQEKDIEDFSRNVAELRGYIADVAPKSKVANEVIDDIEMYVLGIKSGKEIIEKTTPKIYRLKRKDYMEAVLEYLAELKKKYTEDKV